MDWSLTLACIAIGIIGLTLVVVAVCLARPKRDGQIGETVGRYPGQRPKRRPPGRKGHSK